MSVDGWALGLGVLALVVSTGLAITFGYVEVLRRAKIRLAVVPGGLLQFGGDGRDGSGQVTNPTIRVDLYVYNAGARSGVLLDYKAKMLGRAGDALSGSAVLRVGGSDYSGALLPLVLPANGIELLRLRMPVEPINNDVPLNDYYRAFFSQDDHIEVEVAYQVLAVNGLMPWARNPEPEAGKTLIVRVPVAPLFAGMPQAS